MKKIYLSLLGLVLAVPLLSAQGLDESWWGVRGGINFSNLSSPYYSTEYLTGFSAGVIYAHPISKFIPIYIEAGLYFEKQGARDNGFLTESGEASKFTKYAFEVPLLLGCHLPLSSDWSVQSAVGLFYSVAVDGSFEMGGEEFDPYREQMLQTLRDTEPSMRQLLHRSDFGVRVGASVLYRDLLFGFTFDGGIVNPYSRSLRDEGYQALSGCFSLYVGCNF